MNERIKTLFIQAGGGVEEENGNLWTYSEDLDPEKFAQLVVKECLDQLLIGDRDEDYDKGIYWSREQIKNHFGVKE
tara:strand:- start:143 stop:370 length:228 start_codon:yes stop_codon:yes gene_type:complete